MIAFFAQIHTKKVSKVIKYLLLYGKRNIIYFLPTFFYKYSYLLYISSVRILKIICLTLAIFEALVADFVWPAGQYKGDLRDINCFEMKKEMYVFKKSYVRFIPYKETKFL